MLRISTAKEPHNLNSWWSKSRHLKVITWVHALPTDQEVRGIKLIVELIFPCACSSTAEILHDYRFYGGFLYNVLFQSVLRSLSVVIFCLFEKPEVPESFSKLFSKILPVLTPKILRGTEKIKSQATSSWSQPRHHFLPSLVALPCQTPEESSEISRSTHFFSL